MRVLVTGAAGFVAPYLARELARRGHEAVATDVAAPRDGSVFAGGFATCDISSADAVRALVRDARPDACVHLAGISFIPDAAKDPGRLYAINIAGTLNLLDAFCAERQGARFLFVSSALVYGCTFKPDDTTVAEDAPVYPLSPYAISKTASEDAVRAYGHYKGLHALVARPSNHTGPGQSAKFVAPSFIGQAREILRGERAAYVAGNLECERDFSDVRDIVRAYATILERGENGFAVFLSEKTDEGMRASERIPVDGCTVRFRAEFDFRELRDTVSFFLEEKGGRIPLGGAHKLVYRLDHFTGVRIGLFCYAVKEAGGSASFRDFTYTVDSE